MERRPAGPDSRRRPDRRAEPPGGDPSRRPDRRAEVRGRDRGRRPGRSAIHRNGSRSDGPTVGSLREVSSARARRPRSRHTAPVARSSCGDLPARPHSRSGKAAAVRAGHHRRGGDTAECPRRTSAQPGPTQHDKPARAEPRRHSAGAPPHPTPPPSSPNRTHRRTTAHPRPAVQTAHTAEQPRRGPATAMPPPCGSGPGLPPGGTASGRGPRGPRRTWRPCAGRRTAGGPDSPPGPAW